MKSLSYPKPLKPGDKVALTAPSSPVPKENLDAAVNSIEMLGLDPVIMASCSMVHGYMAGPDRQRADDLNRAFADETIKGIFCLRGGFGAARLLPLLDFDTIRRNPKVLVGYSDITALHTAINKLCGFVTFHGPMPNTDYRKLDAFTMDSLKACLFSPETIKGLQNPDGQPFNVLRSGSACGPLTGGNLSLLVSTLGSAYEIDTRGKILFLEDVGERPYRLDKALTALSLAGKFRDCSGIILGTFTECEEPDHEKVPPGTIIAQEALSFEQIIEEVILPWNKPVLANFRAGHSYPQSSLPLGAALTMELPEESDTKMSQERISLCFL
ncbi:MAG: LD-carboxypeptidase [Bacillota bacterium]|nr:LD-carboxypeptidase [Bacillota bacterium]